MKKEDRNLFTDKVEISVTTLIDINRIIKNLAEDKNSFIHNLLSDDSMYRSIAEIEKVNKEYFEL
jgi:hypothetical protein